jgi:hypothetical protein
VGVPVEVRVIVSATAAGIIVGTPVVCTGAVVGVPVVVGGLESEGSGEGRPEMEGTEEGSEGEEENEKTGTVDEINDGGLKASA